MGINSSTAVGNVLPVLIANDLHLLALFVSLGIEVPIKYPTIRSRRPGINEWLETNKLLT